LLFFIRNGQHPGAELKGGRGGPPYEKRCKKYNSRTFFFLIFVRPVLKTIEGFTLDKPPAADLTHKLHLVAVPLGNLESP
jgi:hypothetical protein